MKKAVIVGGSSGIGLAFANYIASEGYYVTILDRVEPSIALPTAQFEHKFFDLLYYDKKIIEELALDKDMDLLFITAGFGRIAAFENIQDLEIENLFRVNTVTIIRIIKAFYGRITANEKFMCGIMGSFSGLVNSPLFSVYAATKAALFRFVESVNTELTVKKCENRILNVSPGHLSGTKFDGKSQDLDLLGELPLKIFEKLLSSCEIYIPNFEQTYKAVLEKYQLDPKTFGINSYQYKIEQNRVSVAKKPSIGYMSGTFDLFHIGHLNIIKRAKSQCDYLIVGVHPNAEHKNKEEFIPYEERKSIIAALKYVDEVVESCREDSSAWEKLRYNKLFVGSDYKDSERFLIYESYFQDKDVEIIFFPYTDSTSSTQIRQLIDDQNNKK